MRNMSKVGMHLFPVTYRRNQKSSSFPLLKILRYNEAFPEHSIKQFCNLLRRHFSKLGFSLSSRTICQNAATREWATEP